jgi:peroxiredoxin
MGIRVPRSLVLRSEVVLLGAIVALAAASVAPAQVAPGSTAAPNAPAKDSAVAAAKVSTGKVGEKMPAFAVKAVRGDKSVVDLDSTKSAATTVYLLVGASCPATKPYAERLCALEAFFQPKGVEFVYLYVNVPESLAEKQKFHKECRFTGLFVNDEDGAIARKLGATKTCEAIVAGKDGKVLYRGGIDDNANAPAKVKEKFLQRALDEVLAGKAVTKTTGTVFGCPIRT